MMMCAANFYLGWGAFQGFDGQVLGASILAFVMTITIFWISPDEMREYRKRNVPHD
jgi:hypothetical protein